MDDGSDTRRPPRRQPIAERIAARAHRTGFAERLWERWGRAGPLVDPPRAAAPAPPPAPRPPERPPPKPAPAPPAPRAAAPPPEPAVVPDPRPATPKGPAPPRESHAGRLRVARNAAPATAPPVPDSATIRARRTAERAPDVAPAPPPSRSIDQVHDVLGRLRDAEASFRQSVAQIEAAKSSGKPRPAAPAASDGGLDELLGSSGDRPKLKRR